MTRRSPIKTGLIFALAWIALALPPTADAQHPTSKAVCGHVHAPSGSEKPIAGQQVHRKTNPQGHTYVFGTYAKAQQVQAVTKPTRAHTWFRGHAWSVLVCAKSRQHVGWRFTGDGGTFYALLLPEPPEPPEA